MFLGSWEARERFAYSRILPGKDGPLPDAEAAWIDSGEEVMGEVKHRSFEGVTVVCCWLEYHAGCSKKKSDKNRSYLWSVQLTV